MTPDELLWRMQFDDAQCRARYSPVKKPILRFDHPGRKLAEKYFSARLLGERRKEL